MNRIRGAVPGTMRALQIRAYEGVSGLRLVEVPVPEPGRGEVLVRVLASPVNPSDVMFMHGRYGTRSSLPATPGFEGCAVVVASGGGWMGRLLQGKRVACASPKGPALWAEYAVVPTAACLPMPARLSDERVATALVNPVTAWVMFDGARRAKHRALLQTAAASQVGRMVLRLGLKYRLPVLHIVHRPPLVGLLRGMGAEHVLDSSAEGFREALEEWARRFQATCALDAVGGEITGLLLSAMPRRSIAVVYGALAGTPCRIEPTDLIFRQKRVIGFWLTDWFAQQNAFLRPFRLRPVLGMLDRELRTDIAVRLTLEQAARDLERHLGNASKGKILIVPSSRDAMLV